MNNEKEKPELGVNVTYDSKNNHESFFVTKDLMKSSVFTNIFNWASHEDSTKDVSLFQEKSNSTPGIETYSSHNKRKGDTVRLEKTGECIDLLNVDIKSFLNDRSKGESKKETFNTMRNLSPRILHEKKRLSPMQSPQSQTSRFSYMTKNNSGSWASRLNACRDTKSDQDFFKCEKDALKDSKHKIAALEENIEASHKELLSKGII